MIEISKIAKIYKDCNAISDCNLEFGNSGFHSIVGVSGSGKTTLLNIIGMLDSPTSGEIRFDDQILNSVEEKTAFRKNNIGYVFQDAVMLNQLTVRENIILPLNIVGLQFDEDYFISLIDELQITELMERKVNELSAGQKQRIAIARALICKPKVLLADEPTGNLDEKTTTDVFEILKKISKNILVIVVTHNALMTQKYSDRIIELKFGKIVSDITVNSSNLNIDQKCTAIGNKNNSTLKNKVLFLSWANLKLKKKKMFKIIFITALTLIICSLGIAFVEVSENNNKNVEKYFLDTNLLVVKENMDTNVEAFLSSKYSSDKFFADYSFLLSDSRIEEVTENYELVGIDIKGDSTTRLKNVSTINIDSYYKERLNSSRLIGDFLSGDSDIILSSSMAQLIFPNIKVSDCVGKDVLISGNYYSQSFKVVAINSNEDVSGKVMTYITVDAAKQILQKETEDNVTLELYTKNSYSIDSSLTEDNIFVKDSGKAVLLEYQNAKSVSMIYGKNTLNDGEIMISDGIIRDFGVLFDETANFSVGSLSDIEIQKIVSQQILCISNGYSYFKIVGIYEDTVDDLSCIVNDSDRSKLLQVHPTSINVYMKNSEDMENITASLESKGLSVTSPYLYFKDAVGAKMSSITYIFLFLVILMIFITFLIINTFSKHNIVDSIKDIGLLKAIGASRFDILKIYGIESIMVGAICSVIATVLYPLAVLGFNYMIENGIINVMSSPLKISVIQLSTTAMFGIILYLFSSLPAILKNSKVDAIVSIRKIS